MSWFAFGRGLQSLVLPTKALWLLSECLEMSFFSHFCSCGSNFYTNTPEKWKSLGFEYNALVFRMWHSWNTYKCCPTSLAPRFQSPFYFTVSLHVVFICNWQSREEHRYFRQHLKCSLTTSVVCRSKQIELFKFSYPSFPSHISVSPINHILLLVLWLCWQRHCFNLLKSSHLGQEFAWLPLFSWLLSLFKLAQTVFLRFMKCN